MSILHVAQLQDSSDILANRRLVRERWEKDGVLFFRNVIPAALVSWAEGLFREKLANEDLIDPALDRLVWTGKQPVSRRPCDAIGTEIWHKFAELPVLNDLAHIALDDDPLWIPIVGHRSSLPTGPVEDGDDIFFGRHQDSYFSRGMHYIVFWMPIRDASIDAGSFAVAPGMHKRGDLYGEDHKMIVDSVPDEAWQSADFRAGDLLMFDFFTPHATLPNPSDQIRISLDMRAVGKHSAVPLFGTVEHVEGCAVTIRTEDGRLETVTVCDETYIRDMNPFPRIATHDLGRIAYPGAHVMATRDEQDRAIVLRRNWY